MSTPVKEKDSSTPGKHPLTSSSKETESTSKRHVSERGTPQPIKHLFSALTSKTISTTETVPGTVQTRRLSEDLKEHYELDPEKMAFVSQENIISTLGLETDDSKRLSIAVKEAFPESVKVRRRLSGSQEKREIVYNNIKIRSSVTIHSEEQRVLFPETSPIDNIKRAVERLHNEQVVIQTQIQNETQKINDDWNTNYIRLLLERLKAVNADIQKYTDRLPNLYEKELAQFVHSQKELSVKSKREIQTEVQEFEKTLKSGLRTETEIKIDGTLFANLSQTMREQCPLIYEIVETLLLTTSEGRIATGRRVHRASHALAILCSLKSQRLSNDFKLLFTLLCISFGAGMRFVNVLNHVGLLSVGKQQWRFLMRGCKKCRTTLRN